jgi:acyl carrier protein
MTEFNVEIDRNKLMEITNLKGLYKYIEELATKTNRI